MNELNTMYIEQLKRINAAAAFFATQGYQCETTFFSRYTGMAFTIFFRNINEKETLKTALRQYAEGNDQIVFKDFADLKFYTLRLEIHQS